MFIYKGKEYDNYTNLDLEVILEGLNADEKLKYLYNQKKRIKILMKYNKSEELINYLTKINMQIAIISYDLKGDEY